MRKRPLNTSAPKKTQTRKQKKEQKKDKTAEEIQPQKRKKFTRLETIYQVVPKLEITVTDKNILKIAELSHKHNFKIYLVGGYVRDYFLGRERKDCDFTVVGDSIEFAKIVAEHFKSKIVAYPRFFTAMVPVGKHQYEFVGTRKEIYLSKSRQPIVSVGTLEDDLRRRDFTINAMAVSLNQDDFGKIIDIFDGYRDLQNKTIRTPLDPRTTFDDDPLRMLRSARFASQLGFAIEADTLNAMQETRERIKIVSQERITDEILKIINSERPSIGLEILYKTGILEYVFPELHETAGVETRVENGIIFNHKDVFFHSLKVLDKIAETSANTWLRFATLIHDIAKPKTKRFIPGVGWTFYGHEEVGAKMVASIFRRMRLPLEHIEYVERLVRLHQRPMALVDDGVTDSAVRRLAAYAGDALEDLFLLCRCDITTNNPNLTKKYLNNYQKVWKKVIEVQKKDKLREFQSPVRGEEIMQIFALEPSPEVGIIKTAVEEAILEGIVPNEYEEAKKFILERKTIWSNMLKSINVKEVKKDKDLIKKIFVYATITQTNTN